MSIISNKPRHNTHILRPFYKRRGRLYRKNQKYKGLSQAVAVTAGYTGRRITATQAINLNEIVALSEAFVTVCHPTRLGYCVICVADMRVQK